MRAIKFTSFGLVVIALCSGCRPNEHAPVIAPRASDAQPLNPQASLYNQYVADIGAQISQSGPYRLRVNMNPKAPGPFQYDRSCNLLEDNGEIVVCVSDVSKNVDFAIWFGANRILIADNTIRSVVHIPPIENAAFRGTGYGNEGLLEITAMRLLVGGAVPRHFLLMLHGKEGMELTGTEAQNLAMLIYPDSHPQISEKTRLTSERHGDAVGFKWRDFGGTIYETEFSSAPSTIKEEFKSGFQWIKETHTQEKVKPRLTTVLHYLSEHGFPAATQVTYIVPNSFGSLVVTTSPTDLDSSELTAGPFKYHGLQVCVSIVTSQPYEGPGQGAWAGWKPSRSPPEQFRILESVQPGESSPRGIAFFPNGQDWMVQILMDSPNASVFEELREKMLMFLKSYILESG